MPVVTKIASIINRKFKSLMLIFSLLTKGDYNIFFIELINLFPKWLIRFNSATLLRLDSLNTKTKCSDQYKFSWATANDHAEICALSKINEIKLKKIIASGSKIYIAKDIKDDHIVHVSWVYQEQCFIKGLGFKLDIDTTSAYVFWVFTHPDARGKGLYASALNNILPNGVDALQIKDIFVLTEKWNKYACNYHRKIGFKPLSELYIFYLLGLKISIYYHHDSHKLSYKLFIKDPKGVTII